MEVDIATLGEDQKLLEGIRTTRAIRRLLPDPVPNELIRKVCEAGTYAPSGGNRQPWVFIAVTEPARRAWVAERYRKVFRDYIVPVLEMPKFPEARRRNALAALYLADHLHEVPVHLFVAGWKRRGSEQSQALFPAVQNILLACRAGGLGASLTTMHTSFRAELDEWLGLPPEIPSCALLPIGWPKGKYGNPPRASVDEKLFYERFVSDVPADT